jgi:hypothetical protein
MPIARRRFLAALGLLAGIPSRALALVRSEGPDAPLELAPAPTGTLDDNVVATLVAAVDAIVPGPVEGSHYADFFRWRAEHLSGYRALYIRWAAALDREAARRSAALYAESGAAVRQAALDAGTSGESRESRLFVKFVLRDVRTLFARTDALVQLGYDAWPGTPRGLTDYTSAPPGAKK